jgi:hypothetical protein
MIPPHPDGEWARLPAPAERPAPGLTPSRFAIAVLPATAAVIVLRRRARRRAGASAWRYRTHGEVSAGNRRIVDAHDAFQAHTAQNDGDDMPATDRRQTRPDLP